MGLTMTKIMLVEDDKSLREIYGVRLQAEGYDIKSAGDGEEALAMAVKEHPDLIISDVMMPKISGFDMLDILRSTPETKNIKVIMMTALSSEDQRKRGESLGADRYLVKSQVGIEDVIRTVHDILGDIPGAKPQMTTPAPAPAAALEPTPIATPEPVMEMPVAVEPEPTIMNPEPVMEMPIASPEPVVDFTVPEPVIAPQPAIEPQITQDFSTFTTTPAFATVPQPVPTAVNTPTMANIAIQQPQMTVSEPIVAPTQAAPRPTSIPISIPVRQQPSTAVPQPQVQMPQPTAPFSTPAPASLGERVINPLTSSNLPDMTAMLNQELGSEGVFPSTDDQAPNA